MTRAAAVVLGIALLLPSAPAAAEGGAVAPKGGVFPEVRDLPDDMAKEMLAALDKALEGRDEEAVRAAVEPMVTKRNKAFVPKLKNLLADRREKVAALAATALGSQGDKGAAALLVRIVSMDSKAKDGLQVPDLTAASIESLGRLGNAAAFKAIEDLADAVVSEPHVKAAWAKTVARACTRYFGLTKERRAVSWLIDETERPNAPEVVTGDTPGPDFWKARQETWEDIRWEVVWALKEITGREFETKRRWAEWFKEEGKKAGYK